MVKGRERLTKPESRLLVAVLAVLIAVLCVLIFMLLQDQETMLPGPTAVDSPQPVLMLTGPGKGDAPEFVRPLAAAWAPNGDIYVSDTGNRRICVFNGAGRFLRQFGRAGSSGGEDTVSLEQPAGLAVAQDGRVYVADVRAGAVVVLSAKGKLLGRIRPRSDDDRRQPWAPTDVALTDDRIYVTDARGVVVFSADGSLVDRIDEAAGKAFAYPNGVAARSGGPVVVSDTNNGRVVSMVESGTVGWTVGPENAQRRIIGLPRGLTIAQSGQVLVSDAFLFGVASISAEGGFDGRYGVRGQRPGEFEFPNDVDARGELVVVADKQNNRVQVIRWPGLLGDTP